MPKDNQIQAAANIMVHKLTTMQHNAPVQSNTSKEVLTAKWPCWTFQTK